MDGDLLRKTTYRAGPEPADILLSMTFLKIALLNLNNMSVSLFDNPHTEPDQHMLAVALGDTWSYLNRTISFIADQYGKFTSEWKCYGKKSGWILKLYSGKRNVLFLIPCEGYFKVSFTFGEKALQQIMLEELPGFNKQELLDAKKYAEGRTIQYPVRTDRDAENLLALVRIKLEN